MMAQPLGSTNSFWRLLFSGCHMPYPLDLFAGALAAVHGPPQLLPSVSLSRHVARRVPAPALPAVTYLTRVDGEVIILEYYWK